MPPRRCLQLLLLCGACSTAASAQETTFRAVWLQPIALFAVLGTGVALPAGFSAEVHPLMDLTAELTPYFGGGGVCSLDPCRERVFGLVASAGPELGGGRLFATPIGDLGLYITPKLLVAVANEVGPIGQPVFGLFFVPGMATEVGGGLDLSLELRAVKAPALYVSVVLGAQLTALFNVGPRFDGTQNAPSWPMLMTSGPTVGTRQVGPVGRAAINPNFIRIGLML